MDQVTHLRQEHLPLHLKLPDKRHEASRVLRITDCPNVSEPQLHALLLKHEDNVPGGYGAYLSRNKERLVVGNDELHYVLPGSFDYLGSGDIVRLNPSRGELWVMYRADSPFNSMLVTERCNSWCVMCSQPPKPHDDSSLIDDWLKAIPLMSRDTGELGITGGEPTLLGDGLLQILESCRDHLPETAVHILSNGRNFTDLEFAFKVSTIGNRDLMIGIPLYSDIPWRHEHVVQAPQSFDETIQGILNLARCNVAIEIRIVIHRLTYERLPELARFITRNLPFVAHVAWMGYEPIGFGRTNADHLWVDPIDYMPYLYDAVDRSANAGLRVSIYNHQLCTLPELLWPFARKSISDWKNVYLPVCGQCIKSEDCAGFFHSSKNHYSRAITPFVI